jgi:hypothetical protein
VYYNTQSADPKKIPRQFWRGLKGGCLGAATRRDDFLVQDRFRASLQPLERIDDSALSGRVARLGELIPQLGYFLVCRAEQLCELIDKLIGRSG